MRKENLTGQRFGRLLAIEPKPSRNGITFWLWECDCGTRKEISTGHVKSGRVVSCGCYLRDVLASPEHAERCKAAAAHPRSHGMAWRPEYFVWKSMIQRCENEKSKDYRWYGALGVQVCKEWHSFGQFYTDMGPSDGLTLDRRDPAGNYEPSNCRWVSWEVQRQNTRKNANRSPAAQ